MLDSFSSRGFIILLIRLCGVSFTFLLTVILTRGLGISDYGHYSFLFAIITLAVLPVQIGLPDLIVREVVQSIKMQKMYILTDIFKWSNKILAINTVLVICVLILTFTYMKDYASGDNIIYFAFILIPLTAYSNTRVAFLRALEKDILAQLPEQIVRPTLFLFSILLFLVIYPGKLNIQIVYYLQIFATSVSFVLGLILLYRFWPKAMKIQRDTKERNEWWKSSVYMGLISGVLVFNNSIDIIMIGAIGTNEQVGYYRVAMSIAALVTLGLQTMNLYSLPYITKYLGLECRQKLRNIITRTTQISFMFSVLVVIIILILGSDFLTTVFGEDFKPAQDILVILIIGHLINAFFGPARAILIMSGREKLASQITLIGCGLNVILNFGLIPIYGPIGAAIATVSTIGITKITSFVLVYKYLDVLSWPLPHR